MSGSLLVIAFIRLMIGHVLRLSVISYVSNYICWFGMTLTALQLCFMHEIFFKWCLCWSYFFFFFLEDNARKNPFLKNTCVCAELWKRC